MRRRDVLKLAGYVSAGVAAGSLGVIPDDKPVIQRKKKTSANAVNLVTPKMDRVRIGFIGVGERGPSHVMSALNIEGAEVTAICDVYDVAARAAAKRVTNAGRPAPALYTNGDYDYRHLLAREDVDIVVIATPWRWHTRMAVDVMKAGKHAFVEVPAGTTVDECWELVETSEQTQKHCMMMENVCYGREELLVLNMCRAGVFGELLHGEAAYIHDLRFQMKDLVHGCGSWRTYEYTKRNGNLYPTHGLGPVAQYMGINRGDRMDYLTSVSCNPRVREIYAHENFPEGHERRKLKFTCGDINTTIVRTVHGKTLMIQWDEQLPRPYSRLNLIQGTKGVWGGFPDRITVEGVSKSSDDWDDETAMKAWYDKYEHPLWKQIGDLARKNGGHGGMDFVMMWRIIYCLRNGLPLDQDVYDAASWSVISPLSEWSVAHRSQSIDIPDFTRGQWKSMQPLGIVGTAS